MSNEAMVLAGDGERSSAGVAQRQRRPLLAGVLVLAGLLHSAGLSCRAQTAPAAGLSKDEAQAMVRQVLATELESARSAATTNPLEYVLRKTSPRYSSAKLIVETKDGDVARLLEVNHAPLSAESQQNEAERLQSLLDDPGLQRHRQEREQSDAERARKIMRALPDAFLYEYAGMVEGANGENYRLTFQPNPKFDPDDIEAQVLKGMAGEIWIDAAQHRVSKLEGRRLHDVDYGLGIIGKLDEGGTLLLEQADIGGHQWRTTHMVLVMNARLLIKSVKLDTTLELSDFHPVAAGMSYQQAIEMLRGAAPALVSPPSGSK